MNAHALTLAETAREHAKSQIDGVWLAEMLRITASYLREDSVNLPHVTESARARFRAIAARCETTADTLTD